MVYANRKGGATTGAWPGCQSFCGWKASGSTGKGGLGPYYVQQFMREQSRTVVVDEDEPAVSERMGDGEPRWDSRASMVGELLELTAALCRIPSPTGYTTAAVDEVERHLTAVGPAGAADGQGQPRRGVSRQSGRRARARMLSAHVDTLGAMVKEIRPTAGLRLTRIGGYDWSTIEGEYCTVHTAARTAR